VNTHTRINIPLGRSLTSLAELPAGSTRSLVDPFAPESTLWRPLVAMLVVVIVYAAWDKGLLDGWWTSSP
jgi:hypothetical protein